MATEQPQGQPTEHALSPFFKWIAIIAIRALHVHLGEPNQQQTQPEEQAPSRPGRGRYPMPNLIVGPQQPPKSQ